MVVPTRNRQIKSGNPKKSRLNLILLAAIQPVFSQKFVQFCFPIDKFNTTSSDNSMSITGMEFFAPVAQVLVNAFKQDQPPASF